MSEEKTTDCGALKRGVIDLRCSLDKDHGGPHEATFTDSRTIEYPGALHHATTTEEVTWQDNADGLLKAALDVGREQRKAATDYRALLAEAVTELRASSLRTQAELADDLERRAGHRGQAGTEAGA